jgi:4-amino-4-deoxy-L-arabinose transferase-like glycosyltransferase
VTVFAAAWLLTGLTLFSVAQTRLPHYIFPLFPAAALLVASSWPALPSRLSRSLLAGTGISLGALLAGAWLASDRLVRLLAPAYPAAAGATVSSSALVVAALVVGLGGTALVRQGSRLFKALVVLSALILAIGFQITLPAFSAEFVAPAGQLATRAARVARPCDTLAAVGPYRPSLLFYARRPVAFITGRGLDDDARLAELAIQPGRLFVIAPAALVRTLPAALAALPELEARGGYVLLASDDSTPACTR